MNLLEKLLDRAPTILLTVLVMALLIQCGRLERKLEAEKLAPGLWLRIQVMAGRAQVTEIRNTTDIEMDFGAMGFTASPGTNQIQRSRKLGKTEL